MFDITALQIFLSIHAIFLINDGMADLMVKMIQGLL